MKNMIVRHKLYGNRYKGMKQKFNILPKSEEFMKKKSMS
jgi:hypothetical protein